MFVPGYAVGDLEASVNDLFEPFKFLNQKGLLVAIFQTRQLGSTSTQQWLLYIKLTLWKMISL